MRTAFDRAGGWLSALAAERGGELSAREEALLLFGLVATGRVEEAEAIAARLIDGALSEEIAAGRLVMPLLAARALPSSSRWRDALLAACDPFEAPRSVPWKVALRDTVIPYALPAGSIRDLCGDIAAASDFGLRRPELPHRDDVRDVLLLWTFCFVHERDLEMVCPLARALAFAGFDAADYRDAMRFIVEQQRDDGHFCADELSVNAHAKTQPGFDAAREVYLPLTVGAVWTLSTS